MINDNINGAFEALGGICIWSNVLRLWKDRVVKGVNWQVTVFMFSWGVWNLWYYPSLNQWASFAGGLAICSGNLAWVILLCYIRAVERRKVSGFESHG